MKRSHEAMLSSSAPARTAFAMSAVPVGEAAAIRSAVLSLIFPDDGAARARYQKAGSRSELPGPMAVPLTRRLLALVARGGYVVCEKSDGERMMLLALPGRGASGEAPAAYLLTRSFDVFTFDRAAEYGAMLCGGGSGGGGVGPTLLDGELLAGLLILLDALLAGKTGSRSARGRWGRVWPRAATGHGRGAAAERETW